MPEGWERIEADEAQAALLAELHPPVVFEATARLAVAVSLGLTGVTFAEPGDELEVQSIGNNVARVFSYPRRESVLIQISELVGKIERRDELREVSA